MTTMVTTTNATMTKATATEVLVRTGAAVLADVHENRAVSSTVSMANSAKRSARTCKPKSVNTTRLVKGQYEKTPATRPGCSRCKESELSMKALSSRVNHVEELVMELSRNAQSLVSSLGIDASYLTAHMTDRERLYMSQFRLNSASCVNENQTNSFDSVFDAIDLKQCPELIKELLRTSDNAIPANSPPHTPVSQPDVKPTVYLGDEGKLTAEPESDEAMTSATQRPPPTRGSGGGGASRSQRQPRSAILAQESPNCGTKAHGNNIKRDRTDSGYASDPERRTRSKSRRVNNNNNEATN